MTRSNVLADWDDSVKCFQVGIGSKMQSEDFRVLITTVAVLLQHVVRCSSRD